MEMLKSFFIETIPMNTASLSADPVKFKKLILYFVFNDYNSSVLPKLFQFFSPVGPIYT